jgi:hypothetical protein
VKMRLEKHFFIVPDFGVLEREVSPVFDRGPGPSEHLPLRQETGREGVYGRLSVDIRRPGDHHSPSSSQHPTTYNLHNIFYILYFHHDYHPVHLGLYSCKSPTPILVLYPPLSRALQCHTRSAPRCWGFPPSSQPWKWID